MKKHSPGTIVAALVLAIVIVIVIAYLGEGAANVPR
jgi:hypothetical protein